MSCTLSKRPYDTIDNTTNSPTRESPFFGASLSPAPSLISSPVRINRANVAYSFGTPPKRTRTQPPSPTSQMQSFSFSSMITEDASPPHKSPLRSLVDSSSIFRTTENNDSKLDDVDRYLPRRKRTRVQDSEMTDVSSQRFTQTAAPPQKEITFTLDQVKAIVAKALQEKEEQLRQEYSTILKEKLAEQFENFSKFNQDYVSRQMRESQWDYML